MRTRRVLLTQTWFPPQLLVQLIPPSLAADSEPGLRQLLRKQAIRAVHFKKHHLHLNLKCNKHIKRQKQLEEGFFSVYRSGMNPSSLSKLWLLSKSKGCLCGNNPRI